MDKTIKNIKEINHESNIELKPNSIYYDLINGNMVTINGIGLTNGLIIPIIKKNINKNELKLPLVKVELYDIVDKGRG